MKNTILLQAIAKIIYNLKRLGTFPVIIKSIRKTHQFLNKQRTSTRNSQKKRINIQRPKNSISLITKKE